MLIAYLLALAAPAAAEPPPLQVRVRCPPSPAPAPARPSAEAAVLYGARCASCHGVGGHGDGPVAAGLMVTPRRFSDAFWQDEVKDEELARAILEGGFAVQKSSAMPAHPDLKERVGELVALVRWFRSPTGSVAVEAVSDEGAVLTSVIVDPRADGSSELSLPAIPTEAVALVVRVTGRPEPFCRVGASALAKVRGAECAASVAPQDPR